MRITTAKWIRLRDNFVMLCLLPREGKKVRITEKINTRKLDVNKHVAAPVNLLIYQ